MKQLLSGAVALVVAAQASRLSAQTVFGFQGRLTDGGTLPTALYDMSFAVFDVSSNGFGNQFGPTLTNVTVGVTNGLYNVILDFGPFVFTGPTRWLEIGVRTNGDPNPYQILSPRQPLAPTPYALLAYAVPNFSITSNQLAGGSVGAASIASGQVVKSLNGLADTVTLAAGNNISVSNFANTLTISATGAAGGGAFSLNGTNAYYTGGYVGIGTSAPTDPLEVSSPNSISAGGHEASVFHNAAGTGGLALGWYANGTSVTGGWMRSITGNPLFLGTAGANQAISILNNGYVGIGTTTPGATLDVLGDANFYAGNDSSANVVLTATSVNGTALYCHSYGNPFHAHNDYTGTDVNLAGGAAATFMGAGVGIGTTTPHNLFELATTSTAGDLLRFNLSPTNSYSSITAGFGQPSGEFWTAGYLGFNVDAGGPNNAVRVLTLSGTGTVGIGTTSPAYALDVQGNASTLVKFLNNSAGAGDNSSALLAQNSVNGYGTYLGTRDYAADVYGPMRVNGSICSCSDARFKAQVHPLSQALDMVLKLEGVRFMWKTAEFPQRRFSTNPQIGFIAQEVEKVLPEVVMKDGEGYYSVDYSRLAPVLVEAIKEQQQALEKKNRQFAALQEASAEMRRELAAQKDLVRTMQSRFAALEKVVARITEKSGNTLALNSNQGR